MFIQDLKNDFYSVLRGKRILVIVNYDIDAVCASKILQTLFRYDHMVYSIVPIMSITGLQRAYTENKADVKNVLLINCGVCLDIIELLQPDDDVTFFVCDSHRPMDICNVYSDSQVRLSPIAGARETMTKNVAESFGRRRPLRAKLRAGTASTFDWRPACVCVTCDLPSPFASL